MKITAISREHSNKTAIALVTEPALAPQVFEEFVRRIGASGLRALSFEVVSGCLRCQSETYTPELRADLEQLLTEADDVVSGVAARTQAEIDESEKGITLESAAAGFGLPIV
jgi:hypothetical protein